MSALEGRKKIQFNFFLIQLKLQWWYFTAFISNYVMKGSYTATFIAYIKSSRNLWGLQNCPSWGSENHLKWLQLLVPLEQHVLIKMTFGIKCSSNLFLKKVIRIHQFHRVPYHHYVCHCKSCGTGFAFRTSMLCLKHWFGSVTWQLSPLCYIY